MMPAGTYDNNMKQRPSEVDERHWRVAWRAVEWILGYSFVTGLSTVRRSW